ncbi:DNA-binding MarR family transcriptional regulator [Sphingobium sp. B2D3A]|uniref:MarR family winged helix-turn-helix transcriptional regulator n=2 Tax=Sphingomonadaceae TaxID=41297 RepID=UPI0015EB7043|nr:MULTISPECIES: MarR family winged helix-turn-helix transcriptional regulator [Sphingobium]MCW2388358.1 DNA-binding MarR family transcriptional regulator [Sphingobium sp. B11D3B]MCW2337622.1 DNA-binding MarR family transcriptional regulator [Sphingobium sp. B2D3A]MCW2362166.1 DNA-binding MarR family transcriptional regulator [Sphingobium sp. B10D3B]MCW2381445.1 DNA-binding MarR family transcriptional regulator [Sphingobium sp. B2D3B]MCW2384080.1 DNA-binding MarR family transcriptional regulat
MSAKDNNNGAAGPLEEAWRIFDSRHLPYRLLMLGKMLDRLSVQHIRDNAGVSLAEWRVLAHLAVMGTKSASEVSAAALVDRAEVSRAVRVLEEEGFLRREENPRNRKSSLLVLTEKGQDSYKRVHMDRRKFFSMLTADFSESELSDLDGMLLRMAKRADQMGREGVPSARKKP